MALPGTQAASELEDNLPTNLKGAMTVSVEKGASSWLSTLPIEEHGFNLHKGAFRDVYVMAGVHHICLSTVFVDEA